MVLAYWAALLMRQMGPTTGILSLSFSHLRRPSSRLSQKRKAMNATTTATSMNIQ